MAMATGGGAVPTLTDILGINAIAGHILGYMTSGDSAGVYGTSHALRLAVHSVAISNIQKSVEALATLIKRPEIYLGYLPPDLAQLSRDPLFEESAKRAFQARLQYHVNEVTDDLKAVGRKIDAGEFNSPLQMDWALAEVLAAHRSFPEQSGSGGAGWDHPLHRLACCVQNYNNRADWKSRELEHDSLSGRCKFLITNLCDLGYYRKALTLIDENVSQLHREALAWPLVIESFVSKGRIKEAREIIGRAEVAEVCREVFVRALVRAKYLSEAQQEVDRAPDDEKAYLQKIIDRKRS